MTSCTPSKGVVTSYPFNDIFKRAIADIDRRIIEEQSCGSSATGDVFQASVLSSLTAREQKWLYKTEELLHSLEKLYTRAGFSVHTDFDHSWPAFAISNL